MSGCDSTSPTQTFTGTQTDSSVSPHGAATSSSHSPSSDIPSGSSSTTSLWDLNGGKTLFVGDISRTMDEKTLAAAFARFGAIKMIDIKRDKYSGNNLGYAFVEFENRFNAETAKSAIHGSQLDGRIIRVGWAQKNSTIFLALIPMEVTKEAFCTYMAQFGTIVPQETFISRHRFGFVKYVERKTAERVKEKMDCAVIKLQNGIDPFTVRSAWGDALTQRHCVHVQFESTERLTETDFREIFTRFGEISKISLPRYADDKLKGYGFIHYFEEDHGEIAAATAILALDNSEVKTIRLRCNFGKRQIQRPRMKAPLTNNKPTVTSTPRNRQNRSQKSRNPPPQYRNRNSATDNGDTDNNYHSFNRNDGNITTVNETTNNGGVISNNLKNTTQINKNNNRRNSYHINRKNTFENISGSNVTNITQTVQPSSSTQNFHTTVIVRSPPLCEMDDSRQSKHYSQNSSSQNHQPQITMTMSSSTQNEVHSNQPQQVQPSQQTSHQPLFVPPAMLQNMAPPPHFPGVPSHLVPPITSPFMLSVARAAAAAALASQPNPMAFPKMQSGLPPTGFPQQPPFWHLYNNHVMKASITAALAAAAVANAHSPDETHVEQHNNASKQQYMYPFPPNCDYQMINHLFGMNGAHYPYEQPNPSHHNTRVQQQQQWQQQSSRNSIHNDSSGNKPKTKKEKNNINIKNANSGANNKPTMNGTNADNKQQCSDENNFRMSNQINPINHNNHNFYPNTVDMRYVGNPHYDHPPTVRPVPMMPPQNTPTPAMTTNHIHNPNDNALVPVLSNLSALVARVPPPPNSFLTSQSPHRSPSPHTTINTRSPYDPFWQVMSSFEE